MRSTALRFLACLAWLVPASAQDIIIPRATANPEILRGCLASGKPVELCLGVMTLDCLAESDLGNQNLEERLCIIEERNAWIDLVIGTEARIRRHLAGLNEDGILGDPLSTYELADRSWQQMIEAQCRLMRMAASRDARRAIIQDECARDLTAAQYRSLLDLLAVIGPK